MSRRQIAVIVIVVAIVLLIVSARFMSGIGTANHLLISSLDSSPDTLRAALAAANWTEDAGKNYYIAAYRVNLQSFVPLALPILTVEVTREPTNARMRALTPDFSYTLRGFRNATFSFPFLLEASPDISPMDAVNGVALVVHPLGTAWGQIPVLVSSSIAKESGPADP